MAKKIAFLIRDLDGGGEERILTISANSLLNLGYQIEVVLCSARGIYLDRLLPEINIIDLSIRAVLSSMKVHKYLKNHHPDVLISTTDVLNWSAIIATKFSRSKTKVVVRIPTTISMQLKPSIKRFFLKVISRIVYPFADQVIAVSHESERDFLKFTNVPAGLVTTIYNPVIIPEIAELSNLPPEHKWFNRNNPPVILGVGRLHRHKNFPNLIRAFNIVLEHHEARLIILGEGSERSVLENLISDLNLNTHVSMPGFKLNPYAFMKNSAVFVLSSSVEGLPTALIEALECGCPTISTLCPSGPDEILNGGEHGYLVPIDDPQALATRIIHVLTENKKQVASINLDRFHSEKAMEKYSKLISSMLQDNP